MYKDKIEEYIASYKVQLNNTPKYKVVLNPELVVFQKQMYDMNPVYFTLMGKLEMLEKILDDYDGRRI